MNETPIQLAESLLEEERKDMLSMADLLQRRLNKMIERGGPGMGFDLPTIVSLLASMRDAVEKYRTATAVMAALESDCPATSAPGSPEADRDG